MRFARSLSFSAICARSSSGASPTGVPGAAVLGATTSTKPWQASRTCSHWTDWTTGLGWCSVSPPSSAFFKPS
eukprot:7007153-Alexandrium_andersonii.AAC.1